MKRLGVWTRWSPKKILVSRQQWIQRDNEPIWWWQEPTQELTMLIQGERQTENPLEYSTSLKSMHLWCTANAEALNIAGREVEAWDWHRQANGYWFAALKIHLAGNWGWSNQSDWQPLLRLLLLGHMEEAKAMVQAAQGLDETHVYHDFWTVRTREKFLAHRFAFHLIYALMDQPFNGDQDNEEPLGVFAPLVALIREPDANQLIEPILHVLDWHTHETDVKHRGQYAEFSFGKFAAWPIEILALFRVRECLGLSNPELDHPLMALPLSKLQPIVPLYRDEWTQGALAGAAKLLPQRPIEFWQI
jgi:hypothetical protein